MSSLDKILPLKMSPIFCRGLLYEDEAGKVALLIPLDMCAFNAEITKGGGDKVVLLGFREADDEFKDVS
jgi:hypothetical protein